MDANGRDWPTGRRFWVLLALLFVGPIFRHPWWLLILSAAIKGVLIWAVVASVKKFLAEEISR